MGQEQEQEQEQGMKMDLGATRIDVLMAQLSDLSGNQETRPGSLLHKSVAGQGSRWEEQSRSASPGPLQGEAVSQVLPGSSERTDGTGRPVNTVVGIEGGACVVRVAPLHVTVVGQKETRLKSLQESVPHRMKLEQLMKAEMRIQREKFCHTRCNRRASKELYYILSLFALLVSAIFAAVAQTTVLTCKLVWGPVVVTALVTFATWLCVSDLLHLKSEHKREAHTSAGRQNAVFDVIAAMRLHGAACDLDNLQPLHDLNSPALAGYRSSFSPRAMFVHLFLAGISIIAIASFCRMLCSPKCECSPP